MSLNSESALRPFHGETRHPRRDRRHRKQRRDFRSLRRGALNGYAPIVGCDHVSGRGGFARRQPLDQHRALIVGPRRSRRNQVMNDASAAIKKIHRRQRPPFIVKQRLGADQIIDPSSMADKSQAPSTPVFKPSSTSTEARPQWQPKKTKRPNPSSPPPLSHRKTRRQRQVELVKGDPILGVPSSSLSPQR